MLTGFKRVGRNVSIWPQAKIVLRENISIGNNVIIDDFAFIVGSRGEGPEVKIGSYVHIASHTSFTGGGELILEDFTSYGSGTKIVTGSEHFIEADCLTNPTVPAPYRVAKRSFVHVKKHAMLGLNVTVLPGVTIGEGCVVGACSLVTKDLEPWGIYAGSPARRIRERPKEKILELEKQLLEAGEKERPLVSISCLTYNHARFIRQTLDSFLMQETNFPFEIIVHDDASTDGTGDILREYERRFPNIVKPIIQEVNQYTLTGVYPMKFVYPTLSGKYVAECDGDDYWKDPRKLQKQFDFLENNMEYIMCHHSYLIDNNGSITMPSNEKPKDYSQEELIGYSLKGYGIATCTKMWRNIYCAATKQDFEDFIGDYPFNVMMGMHGMSKFLPDIQPSVYRRMHGNNSWCSLPSAEMWAKTRAMFEKLCVLIDAKGNPRWSEIRRRFTHDPMYCEREPSKRVSRPHHPPLHSPVIRKDGSHIMPHNWR